jgi:hypothetical protein
MEKQCGTMRWLIPVLVLCLIPLAACGNGGGGSQSSLTGNWQATLTNSTTKAVKSESGFFIQSGNSLSGSVLLTGSTACAGVGSAQGQVSGLDIAIAVSQIGETVNLTGTAASDGSTISGDYSILASPCGNSQVGTWTATQVHPLTGSFQATFTSTKTSGLVFHFTGNITQGPNNGGSTASLSGNMTSTDAPCFSTAVVAGQISGTAVVFNLLSSEGVPLGQYTGTTTTNATMITGPYNLQPQSSSQSGCRDFGTGSFSVQLS